MDYMDINFFFGVVISSNWDFLCWLFNFNIELCLNNFVIMYYIFCLLGRLI